MTTTGHATGQRLGTLPIQILFVAKEYFLAGVVIKNQGLQQVWHRFNSVWVDLCVGKVCLCVRFVFVACLAVTRPRHFRVWEAGQLGTYFVPYVVVEKETYGYCLVWLAVDLIDAVGKRLLSGVCCDLKIVLKIVFQTLPICQLSVLLQKVGRVPGEHGRW